MLDLLIFFFLHNRLALIDWFIWPIDLNGVLEFYSFITLQNSNCWYSLFQIDFSVTFNNYVFSILHIWKIKNLKKYMSWLHWLIRLDWLTYWLTSLTDRLIVADWLQWFTWLTGWLIWLDSLSDLLDWPTTGLNEKRIFFKKYPDNAFLALWYNYIAWFPIFMWQTYFIL